MLSGCRGSLVLPFTPREKTKGGILFSQEQLDKARIATTCGYVLKMGDLAYKDETKFNKPWCKVGDWVMFARYAGARLPIEGGEVRILNDDEVLGTIGNITQSPILHHGSLNLSLSAYARSPIFKT